MKRILLLLLLCFSAGLLQAQTIKLKIAGVTDAAGENLLAFEFSDTLAVTIGSAGGGGGIPAAKFEYIKMKKLRGTSTNTSFKRSIDATVTPQVDVELYDTTNVLFYKFVLRDVFVSHFSYLSPECAGCTALYHQVWLAPIKVEWTDVATGNTTKYNLSTKAFY